MPTSPLPLLLSDEQLLLEAEAIVIGKFGVDAVYDVLKKMRDDLAADNARLREWRTIWKETARRKRQHYLNALAVLAHNIQRVKWWEEESRKQAARIEELDHECYRLRAELEEARAWETIPDWEYDLWTGIDGLPDDMRIQRRAPATQEGVTDGD